MNTDSHIHNAFSEEEPRLVPPQVVYEHKDALKKTAVIPLYAKVAAAAAAVALLFGLFWQRAFRPELELTATLKPIQSGQLPVASCQLAERDLREQGTVTYGDVRRPVQTVREERRRELPLLASLAPATSSGLTAEYAPDVLNETTLANMAVAWTPEGQVRDELADSPLGKRIPWGEDREFEGLGTLLLQGWRAVKVEMAQLNESFTDGFRQLKQMPPLPSLHSDSDF